MPHFLIDSKDVKSSVVTILDPETLRHLVGSLRIKPSEPLKLIDENETQYICEVLDVSKKSVTARVLESFKSARRLNFDLYLALSVLKQDAQNLAVENATQLGVKGIYPVIVDNCAVSENIARKKTEKWQKIALESFKQCERADTPKVFEVSTLEKVFECFENIIIFTEHSANIALRAAIQAFVPEKPILAVVGPEGGFSEREFEMFKKYNCVSLGGLILKAPNALSVGLGNIIYEMNDSGVKNKFSSTERTVNYEYSGKN